MTLDKFMNVALGYRQTFALTFVVLSIYFHCKNNNADLRYNSHSRVTINYK